MSVALTKALEQHRRARLRMRPAEEVALGIGAADQAAPLPLPLIHDSRRLDDSPRARAVLFVLEVLGAVGAAAALGGVFGLLMVVVNRAAG